MNWAQPSWLYLLLLLPLVAALTWWSEQKYRRRLSLWWGPAVPVRERTARWLAPLALRLLGLAALICALAQPRWNFEWKDVRRQGADVVIALDVSRSMTAADVTPSRLERAKREIKDLLALSRGDRLALVIYSGVAFIQCPLTHDLQAFQLFLDQAGVDSLPVQGTSLGQALQFAGKALDEGSEQDSKGRAVILISDGEDHEGRAVELAKDLGGRGIAIHTIGVGGQGAPIPLADGGFLKDSAGQMVVSRPNTKILKEIAEAGGGQFVQAADGNFELERIYQTAIRPDLKSGEHQTRERIWIERHAWSSGLALVFLVAETWSGTRGRKRRAFKVQKHQENS